MIRNWHKVKFALTNPPWHYEEDGVMRYGIRAGSRWPFTIEESGGYKPFPFWLTYAKSVLDMHGVSNVLIDSITQQQSYHEFYREIYNARPEYVVIETSTPSIENDLKIAKKISYYAKVILVGTHATVFADDLFRLPYIFAVIKGKYEHALLEILNFEIQSTAPTDGAIIVGQDICFDDFPTPYRDKKLIWQYKERTHGNVPRQVSLMASRGCPFSCSFCQWPQVMHTRYETRSVENIKNEIFTIIWDFGQNVFLYFDDDTFNVNETHTLEIANMIKNTYDLKWAAMCRIDTTSKEAWEELYHYGLTHVNIGIESASPKLLGEVGKRLNIEEAEDKIKHLVDLGMHVHLTFTFGIPGETEEDIELTKDFYNRVNVQSKQQSRCIPMPGTKMWHDLGCPNFDFDGYKGFDKVL